MRTIALYSYKGGVGKSLLAANLAVTLSRLGKSCVLVDWDVDAPSAHNKLGVGDVALGRRGLTGLVEDGVEPPAGMSEDDVWDKARLADISFRPIPNLRSFVYDVPDIREQEAIVKESVYGRIRLVPVGDIYTPHYFQLTWSALWRDIFTVIHRRRHQKATDGDVQKVFSFLRELKASFKDVEYCILDCRSGSSDLTATLTNAWLDPTKGDTLLYLLGYNDDSITYLDSFAAQMNPQIRSTVVPVLCRVPAGFTYHIGDRKLRSALAKLRTSPEELNILHSDRSLEADEKLRLGLNEAPHLKMLTFEYLRLFEKLLAARPVVGGEKPKELWAPAPSLAEALGFPFSTYVEKERIFTLDPTSGAMSNPNDTKRNVSFKVETFHFLLTGLAEGLAEKMSPEQAQADLSRLLFAAGTQCGQRFGEALADQNLQRGTTGGPYEKIQSWCSFDSDVGFGRFELDTRTINTSGQGLLQCRITLHQSFLAPAKDTKADLEGHKFCAFMTGYVKGVLQKLLAGDDTNTFAVHHVEVPKEEGQKVESCAFEVWDRNYLSTASNPPDWWLLEVESLKKDQRVIVT